MANFSPLAAEIGSGVWDTPANFNGFRLLLVGVRASAELCVDEQTAPPIFDRGHHVEHLAHFLVFIYLFKRFTVEHEWWFPATPRPSCKDGGRR